MTLLFPSQYIPSTNNSILSRTIMILVCTIYILLSYMYSICYNHCDGITLFNAKNKSMGFFKLTFTQRQCNTYVKINYKSKTPVFLKVNWCWGVWITGPSIKFTGHSHTAQRRCSDSYWSFGPVMNNLFLDQTNFYWTLPHVRRTLGMTGTLRVAVHVKI